MTSHMSYYELPDYLRMAVNQTQNEIAKEIRAMLFDEAYSKGSTADPVKSMKRYFRLLSRFWWRGDQFSFPFEDFYPCKVTQEWVVYHLKSEREKLKTSKPMVQKKSTFKFSKTFAGSEYKKNRALVLQGLAPRDRQSHVIAKAYV